MPHPPHSPWFDLPYDNCVRSKHYEAPQCATSFSCSQV
jgi:hypothetical protein